MLTPPASFARFIDPDSTLLSVVSDYPQVAAAPSAEPVLQWLGAGLYVQRADNVWVHNQTSAGSWRRMLWLDNSHDAGKRLEAGTKVVNARHSVLKLLIRLGLSAQPYYERLNREYCEALSEESERWRIPYCWGEAEQHRFLFRPIRYLTFCWSFPPSD